VSTPLAGRIQVIWDEVESDLVTELGSVDQKQLHDLLRESQRTPSQPPDAMGTISGLCRRRGMIGKLSARDRIDLARVAGPSHLRFRPVAMRS
jgi:hypothetical protein